MRKYQLFFFYLAGNVLLLVLMFSHAYLKQRQDWSLLEEKAALVERLGLTDLCLFTEARYTRHPSMADLHTPFQDYPISLEHFPSGSLMSPPPHLRAHRGGQDDAVD